METKINQRLQGLRTEFQNGQKMKGELQHKLADLEQTLLRIAGAIQVLEELLESQESKPVESKIMQNGQ